MTLSLAARLSVLVVLALLPPLLIQGWLDAQQRRTREAALHAQAVAHARALQADMARRAEGVRQLLIALSEVPAVRTADAAGCTEYLRSVVRQFPVYALLAVNDARGVIVCNSAGTPAGAYSNAERAYHRRALASGGFAAGDLVTGVATRRRSLHFALPFRRADGATGGIVLAGVDQASLARQLADAALPAGAQALLIDPAGTVAAGALDGQPVTEGWVGQPAPETLRAGLREAAAGSFEAAGPDGTKRLYGVVPSDASLGGAMVAVGLDQERALAEVRDASSRNLLALLLGAVLALGAGALAAQRLVLAPLAALAAAAGRVGGGDLSARADLGRYAGQVREVGAAFDHMAQALAHRDREHARTEAQLREASRAKDEFLAMLAHELRNPLAPLTNAHRLLARHAAPTEQSQQALEMATRQTRQLTRLVDDLLEISRVSQGKIALQREPMMVSAAVHQAVESARAEIEARGQALGVQVPHRPIQVVADPARMAQVLGNLLTNASKYTPAGGTIRIEVDDRSTEVEIRVVDSGVGIEPEELPGLFELFHQIDATLDRAQGGLGIGLALVKRLVELHGGSVAAASPGKGQGATFTVRLPRPQPSN